MLLDVHGFMSSVTDQSKNGTVRQQSCPETPEQNGISERKVRHVVECARTLPLESSMPKTFWVEAVKTAVYLINRQSTPVLKNKSPFFSLYNKEPNYFDTRVFGGICFVYHSPKERDKLSSKAAKWVFIGYADHQKGYLCSDPLNHPDIDDSESKQILATNGPLSTSSSDLSPASLDQNTTYQAITCTPNIALPKTTISTAPETFDTTSVCCSPRHTMVPNRYGYSHERYGSQECWRQAMNEEHAIEENDSSLERHKAQLVAQRFKQEHGRDHEKTFAPVAKMTTIRTLSAVASAKKWNLHQMDVQNAILHGDLKETIYMKPPPGYSILQPNLQKYRSDLVRLANLTNNKIAHTSMVVNTKYAKEDGAPLFDLTLYRNLVGSLIYLTITRPDIAYVVQVLSRYLRGTPDYDLLFPTTSTLQLVKYSDADWAGYPNTGHSTTVASFEIVWLRRLLSEIGVSCNTPTRLYVGNSSAVQIAKNLVFHEHTKHIEVDCHYILDLIGDYNISLAHVPSHGQLANLFTKAMTKKHHYYLLSKLMLGCNMHQPQWEVMTEKIKD
ncbi:uncharacterized protein LOC109826673 [Asparagus officinalis]|uniref:uncharacterized protein LOC109826673 n=1 Tax=Asparagus officinalis TaxID=4686 RepID=UPI00098E6EE8|nr:uncharacterized protein LOC109826673 [Asparagus officinalis]